ncbi:response regulator [Azospirillum canadense]|uniref:response regulator n=1 Tax=Azospirillum canadense TaxID=403962 RepID=UPI0022276595|nr:response regulator [Azospirillum canadense]MCW2242409.1 CheY-like chemotaxis protein [Azospirillum canadense]
MADEPDLHVLVADDEPILALAVGETLRGAGYRVTVTYNGETAIRSFLNDPADVLLTDLQMPRVDGLEVIRQLRAIAPDLPVVVMTGHETSGALETLRSMKAGEVTVVAKPMPLREVLRAVQSVRSA